MEPKINIYVHNLEHAGKTPSTPKPLIIPKKLIKKCYEFLGDDGIKFFKKIKKEQGRVDGVLKAGNIALAIHFREGMQIRNFMRKSGLCKGWSDHDYDNNWVHLVECALKYHPPV